MNVNQLPAVIKQQITNARLPVQYEAACKALAECVTLDEAKTWSDKAEALAAWAKIYKSDRAAVEAKRLKLRAYRRMGELAAEFRPGGRGRMPGKGSRRGIPGPVTLLREHGLTRGQAHAARYAAAASASEFEAFAGGPRPPGVYALKDLRAHGSAAWLDIRTSNAFTSARAFCRKHPAKDLASGLTPDEAVKARELVREVSDWLDEFEQYLPKPPKSDSKPANWHPKARK